MLYNYSIYHNFTVTDTIPVIVEPTFLAYDHINQDMYVTNRADNIVSVIDTTSNTVTDTISAGVPPTGIDYDSVNKRMYVANSGDNTISVINLC